MSSIEDKMYEAYRLGITEDVFREVNKLKSKEENKYCTQYQMYDKAFYKVSTKIKTSK